MVFKRHGFIREPVLETSVLFISVMKWFVISSVVGVLVGSAAAGFLWLLQWSAASIEVLPYSFLLLPVGFFLSALLVHYLAPDSKGDDTENVIEAIHQRSGAIKAFVVPVKLLATIITIAAGGSAGKEGPCANIGGGIASQLAKLFRFSEVERKKIVICGVSAGFATVFGTPVAGALFGVEVLAVGQIQYSVMFPSFIAGIVAYQVSAAFGTTYFHHPIAFIPSFSELFFFKVVLYGAAFGIIGVIFIEVFKRITAFSERLHWWPPLKGLLGGFILMSTLFVGNQYLGLGLNHIEAMLNGTSNAAAYDPFMKILATSTTLAMGGSGGAVTPIFFIGSTSGNYLASLIGVDASTGAALGMVALLSGCANTPIAASVMAIEMFGASLSPYAAVACVVSFLVVGHRSIFPSQLLAMAKSASLKMDLGVPIEDIGGTTYSGHPQSILGGGRRLIIWVRRRIVVRNHKKEKHPSRPPEP
jgi:H+/Cl- antiporter ClcA